MTPQLRFPEFTDEWQVEKLGDIAVKVSDRNNATSASTVLTNSAVHGVIPQTDFFDKEIAVQGNLSNYYKTELDDFVYNPRISTSAPVGPFKRNNYGSGVLSPLYNLYRFRGGQVLTFFEQYLKSIHWHKYMKDVANYGARSDRMAISSADLLALPLPYPSKPEQEKIADFLTAVDERIAVSEKKLELLETYKRGVMQKIFSQQIRFKDENGNPYPDWEEKKLGEVASFVSGYTFLSSTYSESGMYKIITIANVQDGRMNVDKASKINTLPGNIQKNQVLERGDILVSMTGNVGRVCKVNIENCLLNQRVGKIVTKNMNADFLFAVLNSRRFLAEMESLAQGGAQGNLSSKDIMRYMIKLPSRDEQQKIADFLTALDDKITAEKSKLTAAKQFKKALLQRMFV